MVSSARSTATVVVAGSAILIAAAVGRRLLSSSTKASSSSSSRAIATITDIDDEAHLAEEDYIQPEDVIKIFDALFLHMQSVLAQMSQQIQQIQASGQMIPEPQLRQLLKTEFERTLLACQGKVFEDCDVDEDCLKEATLEFMAKPGEYPKVRRSVERFQMLYENVSGESIVEKDTSSPLAAATAAAVAEMSKEKLLKAATAYFDALTDGMREIVLRYKAHGKKMSDVNVAQQLHMEFASVANDVGEAALQGMDITTDTFRAAIEKHSSNADVGRSLAVLQMKQQQELMAMGVPAM